MKKWFIPVSMLIFSIAGVAHGDLRGASSDVKGSISDVNHHAQNVFDQMGITKTGQSMASSGTEQTLTGKKGDINVQVQLKRNAENETHVDVVAKQGDLKWNKDYAQNVLSKIIQSG